MDGSPALPSIPSYRTILAFYFPLALSWIFMALELPITTTVVSRSLNAEIQTAAMLMLGGLSLWIESPVIDLLATSTTLAKNARSFAVLSRFVWWVMGWCTLLHAAIALTPLYGWVTESILGIPHPVAEAARIPMAIMIPWSAFIGWRRYLQGILIRFGRTRVIGFGTAVRVATMAAMSYGLFVGTQFSGVTVAACALVASVTAEALFIHWVSRDVVNERLRSDPPEAEVDPLGELTMKRLLRFHLPLTATTMTFIAALPLVSAAIARSPDNVAAMAGWQVATSLIFLHRTVVFALPEPVIALYKGPETAQRLARFCTFVGLGATSVMLSMSMLGGDRLVFGRLFKAEPAIVSSAAFAFLTCAALPLVGAMQSYLRGMLTAHHFTSARFVAVIASTAVLLACLGVGVAMKWPGVSVAAFALNLSTLAELAALAGAWSLAKRKTVQPVLAQEPLS